MRPIHLPKRRAARWSPYLDRLPLGVRCIDGRLWKHVPQFDDPDFEQDIGVCEGCAGCDPTADEDENEDEVCS